MQEPDKEPPNSQDDTRVISREELQKLIRKSTPPPSDSDKVIVFEDDGEYD